MAYSPDCPREQKMEKARKTAELQLKVLSKLLAWI